MHWTSITQAPHIEGLMALLRLRDSNDKIKTNRHIQRVVAWADILHATVHNSPPRLGATEYTTHREMKRFMDVVKRHGYSRMIRQNSEPAYFREVLSNLQALVIARSLLGKQVVSDSRGLRPIFSSLLIMTEYLLLDLGNTAASPNRWLESANGVKAVKAAALIFAFHGLRDMAITAAFFDILIQRLHDGLCNDFDHISPHVNPVCVSDGAVAASLLLWLCLNGWKACTVEPRQTLRESFVQRAATVCKSARIDSSDRLCSCIGRMFLMTEDYLLYCSDLWADVKEWFASHDHEQAFS